MSTNHFRARSTVPALALTLLISGCAGSTTPVSPSPAPTTPAPTPTPTPAPTPTPTPAPPPAPTVVSLAGTVVSGSGSGIAGATVTILDGSNAGKSATTNGAGAYRLDGLQASNGNVSARATGYQDSVRGLYIDGTATLNFTLQPVPAPPSFTGVWRGRANSTSCRDSGAAAGFCRAFPSYADNQRLVLTLTQTGQSVTGTIDVGGYPVNASGSAQGDRLSINGTGSDGDVQYEYKEWNSTISGSSMSGTFTLLEYLKSGGSVQYGMILVDVTRVSTTVSSSEGPR